MGKYFDKFPVVSYNGQIARNILAKVDFTSETRRDIYSSFDFVLTDDAERSDLLSEVTYNSPEYDWLVFLANDIVDPYYDYYLSQDKMNTHILAKYGNYANAESQILYYRNNWAPDDSVITESVYEALDNAIKKYYKPIVSQSNVVTGYERKKEDWIVSTNKIVDLYVANSSGFSAGERVTQGSSGASATVIKTDEEESTITVKHVEGTFTNGSFSNTTITNIVLIDQSIPDDESSFWAPVNAYDQEAESNEVKKYISLIKASYLPDIEKLFTEQMKK